MVVKSERGGRSTISWETPKGRFFHRGTALQSPPADTLVAAPSQTEMAVGNTIIRHFCVDLISLRV